MKLVTGSCALLFFGVLLQSCRADRDVAGLNGSRTVANRSAGEEGDDAGPVWGPWSTPVNLGPTINSSANDQHPGISRDGLSLYFTSDRQGGLGALDLYVSRRKSLTAPWGPPVNLGPNINSAGNEMAPTFSRDGHLLYFHSAGRGGCGGYDLFVSHRRNKRDDLGWEPARNLGCVVNSQFDDAGPTIFEDENTGITTLYFTSNRPGGPGDFDIYASTRVGDDGEFGPGVLVAELSSPFRDTRTALRRDGLEIFLSSDSQGRIGGFGGQDLWVSTRATTVEQWSIPVNVGPTVNTPYFDGAPALSYDGTTLYFFSNRPGGLGGNDLYVTTRARLRDSDDKDDDSDAKEKADGK